MTITDTPASDGTIYRTLRWEHPLPSSAAILAWDEVVKSGGKVLSSSNPTKQFAPPREGTWMMTIHFEPAGWEPPKIDDWGAEPDEDRDYEWEPDPDAYVEDRLLDEHDRGLR